MNVFITKAIEKVADAAKVFGEKITSGKDKDQANKELTEVVMKGLNDVASVQGEVIKTEMQGSFLQRNWRPLMMLTFGVILVCEWFGLTDPAIPKELEMQLLDIVKLGLGGYVVGRSVEKVASTVTKNVDMPFLKKKDRK